MNEKSRTAFAGMSKQNQFRVISEGPMKECQDSVEILYARVNRFMAMEAELKKLANSDGRATGSRKKEPCCRTMSDDTSDDTQFCPPGILFRLSSTAPLAGSRKKEPGCKKGQRGSYLGSGAARGISSRRTAAPHPAKDRDPTNTNKQQSNNT